MQVTYKYPNIDILLFARLPVLGKVKTRLKSALSNIEILALYEAMLKRIVSLLNESNLAEVQLWLDTDSAKENNFVLDVPWNFKMNEQVGEDLGDKMNFAINETLVSTGISYQLLSNINLTFDMSSGWGLRNFGNSYIPFNYGLKIGYRY